MSVAYNLRRRKKDIPGGNCHLRDFAKNMSPETFNAKVCLERLKLLESHDNLNKTFYLKNGRITLEGNKFNYLNRKQCLLNIISTIIVIIIVIIITISSVYWRDNLQNYRNYFAKKCSDIYPVIQEYYSGVVKFQRSDLKQFNDSLSKLRSENTKSESEIPVGSLEVRNIVRDYFAEVKKKNKIQDLSKSPSSFIEEQCKAYVNFGNSTIVKNYYNMTLLDAENLTDYALESQGARIVTDYDTELYGTVKFFNFILWPRFSKLFMKYLKGCTSKGPNSVLMPWKRPGDCWAFKGSRGRIQIELSDEIIITAVSIDHIPKEISPDASMGSAPKSISISGIREYLKETKRTYLGSCEYKSDGPSTQTFPIQSNSATPFKRVEVIIESNHGNRNYTCVYKIRVHGHK